MSMGKSTINGSFSSSQNVSLEGRYHLEISIPTCPRAVLKDNCQAGRVLKKKLTVRAEKIKMAEELEILRRSFPEVIRGFP